MGGAIGVAVASTIFATRTADVLAVLHAHITYSFEPDDLAFAFTSGFTRAFWVAAFTAVAGTVAAIVMIRGPVLAPEEDDAGVQSTPVGASEGSASG